MKKKLKEKLLARYRCFGTIGELLALLGIMVPTFALIIIGSLMMKHEGSIAISLTGLVITLVGGALYVKGRMDWHIAAGMDLGERMFKHFQPKAFNYGHGWLFIGLLIATCSATTAFAQEEKTEMHFNVCKNDTFQLVHFDTETNTVRIEIKLNVTPNEEMLKKMTQVRFNWFYHISGKPNDTLVNYLYATDNATFSFGKERLGKTEMDASVESATPWVWVAGKTLTCEFKISDEQVSFLDRCRETSGLPDDKIPEFEAGNLKLYTN